jgi:YVTN family beta-propeller protein
MMPRLFQAFAVTAVVGLSAFVVVPAAQALTPNVTTITGLNNTFSTAFSPDGATAYVVENDDGTRGGAGALTLVDTRTKSVVGESISLGDSGGATNRAIAMAPDGSKAYISMSNGTLLPFYPETLTFGPAIAVGNTGIGQVVFTPDGTRAFVAVTDYGSGNLVKAINVGDDTVVASIIVGLGPNGMAITPDGLSVFVNCSDGSVSVIETTGNTVVQSFTPSGHAQGTTITMAPNGSRVYVTAFAGGGPNMLTSVVYTTTYATDHQFTGEPKDTAFDSEGATAFLMSASLGQLIPTDAVTFDEGTPITVLEPTSGTWLFVDKNPRASQYFVTGGNWVVIVGDGPELADTGVSNPITTVLTGATLVAIVGGVLLVARRRLA